jgi:hypothetical protein
VSFREREVVTQACGERVQFRLRGGDPGSAREIGEQDLAFAGIGLLRHVSDRERGWRLRDSAGVGLVQAGGDAKQRRFPHAVRAHDSDASAGRDAERDPDEDRVGAVVLGDLAESEQRDSY